MRENLLPLSDAERHGERIDVSADDRLVIAFVQGAQFWMYHTTGFTAFSSERHEMEEQAERVLKRGELGKTVEERLEMRRTFAEDPQKKSGN